VTKAESNWVDFIVGGPETAQHSGHADIIRKSFDGAKTMG
jgi:Protein of unknown function (DUF664)